MHSANSSPLLAKPPNSPRIKSETLQDRTRDVVVSVSVRFVSHPSHGVAPQMKPEALSPEQRSLEFLRTPDEWPNWPLCPVKKRLITNVANDVGLVAEGPSGPEPVVFLCNLWRVKEDFANAVQVKYESLEALVADGWRVD